MELAKEGRPKESTEGLQMAAREQALRTKSILCYIDKIEVSLLCRFCGEQEETMAHILSECKQLILNSTNNGDMMLLPK